jgi:ABC-2 type transport system ATP-binding protein
MRPEGSIVATNIWKRFRQDRGRMLLRDRLQTVATTIRGRRRGWRWALRDVDVVADPGECLGLVGMNGSGKTTMLKILARVMYPYAGRVRVHGRTAALIEVRAGLHPELSGRENILLQGALLGLNRRAIATRFDDIVEFAELQSAVDRQVKFFSSGMQARLGFAIAAHLDPHVLLVDEVLAVGDAGFQQRCLDRIGTVLSEGTTVVFVSHDLASVEALCSRVIWIDQGTVQGDGAVREVLADYRSMIEQVAEIGGDGGLVRLLKLEIDGPDQLFPRSQAPLHLRLILESKEPRSGILYLGISEGPATPIFTITRGINLAAGESDVRCTIEHLPLPRGRFFVWAGMFTRLRDELIAWQPVAHLDVVGPELDAGPLGVVRLAPIHIESSWEVAPR